jgi:hypothetical protein
VTSVADYRHNHALIYCVISKHFLKSFSQVIELLLARNLAFQNLSLYNALVYLINTV